MAVWHKSGSVSHQWYGFCVYGNQNLMYILSTINVLRLSCRTQVITKNACIWTFHHQVFWEQIAIRYGFYSYYIFMLRKLFGKRQGQSAFSSFCCRDLIQFLFALICISGRSRESFTVMKSIFAKEETLFFWAMLWKKQFDEAISECSVL